jgi:hypothetical protein
MFAGSRGAVNASLKKKNKEKENKSAKSFFGSSSTSYDQRPTSKASATKEEPKKDSNNTMKGFMSFMK